MKKFLKRIWRQIDLKKQADELGLKVWQTPGFLFILMGAIAVVIMLVVYFSSQRLISPELLIISETAVAIIIISVGGFIIKIVEEMAKANKVRSDFVSIASHQLKTPLSQINWETELLISRYKDNFDGKQMTILNSIVSSNDNMIRLVNDLLDVVRIDQGELFLNKEKIDMVSLVEEVVSNNSGLARANNVEIRVVKPKYLPTVVGDKRRLRVALDNLVSNAIKYVDKQGFVEIRIIQRGNYAEVYVKDNGIGIPENQQERVFEKFFRSDNSARYKTDGTGLGLYITKNIVEQSGGQVWFKSIEGIGSLFCLSLPIARKENLDGRARA